jgi:hypothetical protein
MRCSREGPVQLREATERDVPAILALVNDYARHNPVAGLANPESDSMFDALGMKERVAAF